MTTRTYALTEIVGTSPVSIDEAIRNGLKRASQSTRHIDWFEVTEIRGNLRDGDLTFIQVGMKDYAVVQLSDPMSIEKRTKHIVC